MHTQDNNTVDKFSVQNQLFVTARFKLATNKNFRAG